MTNQTVLVIKSIFCPDLFNLNISIEGLKNIFNLINNVNSAYIYKYKFGIVILGWCKKKEYKEQILVMTTTLIKTMTINTKIIEIDIWDHNYGKFRIMNKIIDLCKIYNFNYNYILYSDHDIIFPLNQKIFVKMIRYLKSNIVINTKPLGLIAFSHKEDIRHQFDIYSNNHIKYTNLIYPDSKNFTSIATGAYFSYVKIFALMKKFKLISVYGFDDYCLLKELDNMNYFATVHKNLNVIHSFQSEQNIKYIEWKNLQILTAIKYIKEEKYDEMEKLYLTNVIESENVWN